MSLDLSATLLVTDLAPIPALIQRLGRLNRRARLPSDPIMPFIVIEPLDKDGKLAYLPYEQEQLEEARVWLSKLPNEITQQDLVEVWESLGTFTKEDISTGSKWIDGGYDRTVKELRDASPGVTIIMRSDLVRVRSGECSLAEVVIPMNPRQGIDFEQLPKFQGVPIVDETQLRYSEILGGEWI
jgi:CRISPR-associated endonuclease/helicase Cas3